MEQIYDVTIAMPVYNVAGYIRESLLSALAQTYPSIEFLIIDDKGNDNSIDIVRDIKSTHKRGCDIRIIDHGVNRGTGATKNTALLHAKGKFIFFMDSDDIIAPNVIELLLKKSKETNADVVMASYDVITTDGKVIDRFVCPELFRTGEFSIVEWMGVAGLRYYTATWNKLYKLDFLRENKVFCFPRHRNEDNWFSFQVVLYASSIYSIPNVTYHYIQRENSTVHRSLDDFYYNQYIELFEARLAAMMQLIQSRKVIPQGLYSYMVEPLLYYQLPQVINSDFLEEKKIQFIEVCLKMDKVNVNSENVGNCFKGIYKSLHTKDVERIKRAYRMKKRHDYIKKVFHKIVNYAENFGW